MGYSFEYIDIILLAMIAGFIFLRLRGILGKKTGYEAKAPKQFKEVIQNINVNLPKKSSETFDEKDQKEFLKGAKIAYETIITDFSDNDNKITTSKSLLNQEIYNQFTEALKQRNARGHEAEITFIGVNSAKIKEHKKVGEILNVTVEFIAEVITCIKDKEKNIISGSPDKIKKIYDTWVFSRDTTSSNPNWQLVNILTQLTEKFSDKDITDWENFISSNEKLHNKDETKLKKKINQTRSLDLHGFSLEDANTIVEKFILESYYQGVGKLIIITGKGLHSQNEGNPFVSKDLSILKYSVPEFISKNEELMKIIFEITDAKIEDGGSGSFYVYLKKNKKI